ncbi:unnamed protein product, partial [Closterium sp. NIES-54]
HNHQTGAVSAVPRGVAKPRPYYVLLLQQVLGLEPSPGPTPPLLSPPSVQSQLQLQPASPLPGPSPYSRRTRGLRERREPELRPVSPESRPESPESCFESPVRTVRVGRRVTRPSPPVPGTHSMTLRTSTAPQRDPVPSPPASSLPDGPDPESDSLRAASPTVTRFLATAVTNPLFESTTASALIAELVDFAAAGRLEYSTSLVAESASVCPPSVGGECALGTNVLEDRLEEFECFAAAVPHLVSMLLAPEGDPDAPDIPTPCSYAEAIEGSPPVFKAHYVARGVNHHQDGGAWRNQKNGANMVADSSDNNPKSNGGAEKKQDHTAGQFFHIGEQGEQGDASAKVGAELHPLDYWVCSTSGHALKVAGAGRAAFKGADGKPVVLHDVLLAPDLKANLISLHKLAKAGVSTSTDEARTYKRQLGNQVLWDLHESKDVYRSMWQLPALAWHGGGQAGEGY